MTEPREPDSDPRDGPAERAMGLATWVVALLAVLVVIGLVIFLINLGTSDHLEGVGL